jgi:hypothetical protein
MKMCFAKHYKGKVFIQMTRNGKTSTNINLAVNKDKPALTRNSAEFT